MPIPTRKELLRAEELGRIQFDNMVLVLHLFNASVEASMNTPPEKKEDANATKKLG